MDEIDVIVTLCREEQCPCSPLERSTFTGRSPIPLPHPRTRRTKPSATRDELIRRLPPLLKAVEAGDELPA